MDEESLPYFCLFVDAIYLSASSLLNFSNSTLINSSLLGMATRVLVSLMIMLLFHAVYSSVSTSTPFSISKILGNIINIAIRSYKY